MSDRLTQASFKTFGQADQESAETPDLFAYGTLAFDEVIATLIDRVPANDQVSAPGWRSARLSRLLYPGLIARLNEAARGRVYTDLTRNEWMTLDAFEDPTYALIVVRLVPTNRTALAYVWTEATEDAVWQPESLTGRTLAEYLTRCARWRRSYEGREC